MVNLFHNAIYSFLISFGVMVGASIFAGVGAVINNHPLLEDNAEHSRLGESLGNSHSARGYLYLFEVIDKGLFRGK